MKTNSIFAVIALTTTLVATTATAQSQSPGAAATPAAPVAQAAQPVPAAPAAVVNPMPVPNQIIYLPQLPSPASLVNVAAAQGLSIDQISQTSTQIIVVYKYSNGQTNTICYQLLSTAGVDNVAAANAPVVVPAQTTVIYETRAPAYYYDPFYYPWPWVAPVAIGLDFGFRGGYYHGGFHGGHRGWR
jgi:3-oxoacyl-ACP reductase-like protein